VSNTHSDDTPTGLEIAVIGMAGRFPGAADIETYWRNLCDGRECLTRFSDAELLAAGVPAARLAEPGYVKVGGVLDGIEDFDAAFFGYSPREAASIDPQQRLFLETAWTALEHAGYDASRSGTGIGVYAGVGRNTYLPEHVMADTQDAEARLWHPAVLGNDKDFLATRVSYKLNLEGPSVVVQTACSTSLVAIHVAVQSLLGGECDMALAGGATIRLPQLAGYHYLEDGILSPDGHCRAFDAAASGCVPGNGVGVVVLKRLADALDDGDTIHAVIKGSAINNDGAGKAGYTAPRIDGQAAVIRAAQRVADVAPATIGYVEAHGTGTVMGDPIEIAALTQSFAYDGSRAPYCALGAVKTNIGHLDTAAGVAGFIKAVLAVEHNLLPPSLHFATPNPKIDFAASPFYVNTQLREWPVSAAPRRAAVSAFGIGGTNAHVILEQAPRVVSQAAHRPCAVLLSSARTPAALQAGSAALANHLRAPEYQHLTLADMAYTSQLGRRAFNHRRAVICADRDEALASLDGTRNGAVVSGSVARVTPRLVHVFPGQGSQHAGMGRGLYASEPVFRDCIDRCATWLAEHVAVDLRATLFDEEQDAALSDTRLAQPALFALEYALAELLEASGLPADAMLGHSLGEYVAACRAGVFSLEDGLRLVAARGRLMSSVPPGDMLAVPLAVAELTPLLGDELDLAAINADGMCVVSGPGAAIAALKAQLAAREVESRVLATSHAFHSRMLEPILADFAACFDHITLHAPTRPYVSNLSGDWITAAQATDRHYWVQHLRQPVQFAAGLRTLLDSPDTVLLEAGPGQAMSALARRNGVAPAHAIAVMPAADQRDELSEARTLATALARAWVMGAPVDWASRHGDEQRRRVPLPTYPFERQRHWMPAGGSRPAAQDPLRKVAAIEEWFYVPSWKRAAPLPASPLDAPTEAEHWLVFADNHGLGARIGTLLRDQGHRVSTVVADQELNQVVAGFYTMRAGHAADMDGLLHLLRAHHGAPTGIVHCWGLNTLETSLSTVEQGLNLNFYSVLDAVQALERAGSSDLRRLAVITQGAQQVHGDEPRAPFAAATLGAVRVLPREWPQLACTHIDVELDGATLDTLAMDVIGEIREPHGPAVLALRRHQRWLECFEPVPLPVTAQRPDWMRERGTYLITGGLGGVGLATAEYLAQVAQARVVLCTRSAFAPRAQWDALSSVASHAPLPALSDFVTAQETALLAAQPLTEIVAVPGLAPDLEALCAAYAWQVLEQLLGRPLAGVKRARDDWRAQIAAPYRRQFDALLRWLGDTGLVQETGTELIFSAAAPAPAAQLQSAVRARHAGMAPLLDLMAHCAAHTGAVLDGTMPGLEVLFSESALPLFRAGSAVILEHSRMRIQHQLLRALCEHWLATRAAESRELPVRILEVGGGEGHLAWTLAPVLAGHNVEYHYTDIARSFVASAAREAQARGIDFMRFATLDLEQELPAQNHADASVDVVLAFNVVHATRDIATSLQRLARVLKPGGALLLIESLRSMPWVDLIWGLTEGWWHYEDEALRGASPLLEAEGWRGAMLAAGFDAVEVWPQAAQQADAALIAARKPHSTQGIQADTATAATIAQLRRIEALGGEVMIARTDVTDATQVAGLLSAIEQRFGALNGVFHSALVLNDSAAALKTHAEAAAVMAPKVHGTLVLADALRGRDLDCFVVFSSLAAVVGVTGQIDYCAASNVVDAWVEAEAAAPTPIARLVTTVDWGVWRDAGMAARLSGLRGERQRAALREGMSSVEGMDALSRVLHRRLPRVAISSQRLSALLAPPVPLDHSTVTDGADASPPLIGDSTRPYTAPRDAAEQTIASLWQDLLGVPRIGVDDNFFELGGDSVIGLQFIARARRAGLTVNNKELFQHQTVAALAAACAATATDAPAVSLETQGERPRFPAARASDEELQGLLATVSRDDGDSIEDIYELAPMQQGMLFHTLDAPASGVYCSRLAYSLHGPLDGVAFAQAWQDMLDRHPILRTSFHFDDLDKPLQVVHSHIRIELEQQDWRALDEAQRAHRLDALLDAEGRRGFALDQAPLLRLILVHCDVERWQFVLVHHHLLMDGWCRAQLFEELFACYRARQAGQRASLPPAPAYRLFIDWLHAQNLEETECYWRRTLAGFRVPTPLSGDLPERAPGEVLEYRFELDADASANLAAELRRRHLTLSTVVSGAWALWLAAQSQRDDVVFGATIAGRPASLAEAENIVGLFINTLAVRARIDREAKLATWLATLQVEQAESRQYEQTPLALVQEWADTPRSSRLFESLVVIENSAGFHGGPEQHGDIDIAATRPVIRNSYPLTLRGVPGEVLQLQLLYDSARFSAAAVAAIADNVLHCLRALAQADTLSVGALLDDILAARRRHEESRMLAFKDVSRQRLQAIKRRPS